MELGAASCVVLLLGCLVLCSGELGPTSSVMGIQLFMSSSLSSLLEHSTIEPVFFSGLWTLLYIFSRGYFVFYLQVEQYSNLVMFFLVLFVDFLLVRGGSTILDFT